jgi:hypothetical protein
MAEPDDSRPDRQPRKRLLVTSIQRGNATRYAIKAIRLMQAAMRHAIGVLVAVVIVFEEWGWRPLAAALGQLARFRPIAMLEGQIVLLPPWASLCIFVAPTLLFLPLKLLAVWLVAGGHVMLATGLFAFAKVVGTALFARIFQLTQPRLMELAWFARLYNWFLPWKEHLVEQARATRIWQTTVRLKLGMRRLAAEAWERLRPTANAFLTRIRDALGR